MSSKHFTKALLATAALVISVLSTQTNTASAVFGKKLLDQTGCPCFTCPSCRHTCNVETELVDEDRLCFDVEEKVICIPRVVFPWQKQKQSCCGCTEQPCSKCNHNGAKTRKVCVIKESKYTCPKCEYTWSPEEKGCSTGCAGGCCAGGCCEAAGCASAPCDAAQWNSQPGNSQPGNSQPGNSQPVVSDYEAGAVQDYPWKAAELVVSDLSKPQAIEQTTPAPVVLPQ